MAIKMDRQLHDMAAFPGPLAVQMTEPSNTVYQSWKDMADNPSDLSGYGNDHTTSVVELPVQCSDQDGQTTHDMAAFPGPLAFQMTEPSNTVRKSWRDMADSPSDLSGYGNDHTTSEPSIQCSFQNGQTTHDMVTVQGLLAFKMTEPSNTVYQSWSDINPSDLSGFGNDHTASAFYMSTARINQRVNTGHGSSIPQQESGVTEDFPRTRSGNSLIFEDDHDDDSFGCLRAAFKGLRPIPQKLKQLVTRMMGTNEEQIRGPNVADGRNPNIGFVCNSVQISCCHVVCLPFNDGRYQDCKEPVDETMEHL